VADRIPVGTRVIVAGTGFGSKPRKGVVRPPELDKGYYVQFDHSPTMTRCPDKKVKRLSQEKAKKSSSTERKPTKLTIPDDVIDKEMYAAVTAMSGEPPKHQVFRDDKPPNEVWGAQPNPVMVAGASLNSGEAAGILSRCYPQEKPTAPRRSKAYLAYVRRMDCCNCGAPGPSDPHHEGKRGVGQKTSDLLTAPLDRRCHRIYTDENQLPDIYEGKDHGRRSREESLAALHGAQVQLLLTAIDRLPLAKRAEILAAALALVDEETLEEVLK
jgi:hypothetical protein